MLRIAQNDDELNEIIARGDEEVDIFTRMDEQRKAQEQHDWRAIGGRGSPPDRLMTDAELPEIYRHDPVIKARQTRGQDDEPPQFDDVTGRRKRKGRNEVIYDDGLCASVPHFLGEGSLDR